MSRVRSFPLSSSKQTLYLRDKFECPRISPTLLTCGCLQLLALNVRYIPGDTRMTNLARWHDQHP